jgi:hypothetical protein
MKKPNERGSRDDMRAEYDFASLSGGIRAKHYQKYRKGSNVVLLQPDVAEAFPSEEAVNEALRGVLKTTRAVRQTGGLSDHTLQPATHASKRSRT